jgi:hypothetical protein
MARLEEKPTKSAPSCGCPYGERHGRPFQRALSSASRVSGDENDMNVVGHQASAKDRHIVLVAWLSARRPQQKRHTFVLAGPAVRVLR